MSPQKKSTTTTQQEEGSESEKDMGESPGKQDPETLVEEDQEDSQAEPHTENVTPAETPEESEEQRRKAQLQKEKDSLRAPFQELMNN